MRRTRVIATAAALGLMAALVPTSAQAADGGPYPVTALPSALYDWVPPGSPSDPTFAYKSTASPTTTQLAQTPNRTPAQQAALKESATPVQYPSQVEQFKKKTDTGMQIYGEYAFGAQIGANVLDLFGVDANGLVCKATRDDLTGKMVSLLSGQQCDRTEFPPTWVPNTDASGGAIGLSQPFTTTKGQTLQYVGASVTQSLSSGYFQANACFTVSPAVEYSYPSPATPYLVYQGIYSGWTTANGPPSLQNEPIYPIDGNTTYPSGQCGNGESLKGAAQARLSQGQRTEAQARGNVAAYKPLCIWIATADIPYPDSRGCNTPGGGRLDFTEAPSNPERTLECVVLGTDGKEYVGKSGTFQETDDVFQVPGCPELPEGVVAKSVSVRDSAGAKNTLWTQDVSPAITDALTKYPECADGTCILDLRKSGASCFTTPAPCADWYTDPTKTTTYTCHYGQTQVDLSECNLYAPTFKKTGTTVYGDPESGMTQPNPDAGNSAGCDSAGWSSVFNPAELIDSLTCNLASLLVPSPDAISNHLADLDIGWGGTGPGSLTGLLGSWDFEPTATGCAGIPISFPTQGHEPVTTGWPNACDGEFFAPVAKTSQVVLGIAFLLGAGVIAYNTVGSTFGAAPIRFGKSDE